LPIIPFGTSSRFISRSTFFVVDVNCFLDTTTVQPDFGKRVFQPVLVNAEPKATHDKIQSYTAETWWKDLTWKDCELFSTVLEAKARELSFDNIRRDLLTEVHELEQLVHQKAEEEAKVRAAKRIATAKRSMGGPTKKKRSGKSPMFYRAS
jgi:hypothetical protein